MPILAYDPLPEGSDLAVELSDKQLTITASVREPSARSIRFIRRSAAFRAIPDCLLGVMITFLVIALLLGQINHRPNLPPFVFPIIAVFVAAIYLLAWKGRADAATELLHQARGQVTVLHAKPVSLRIDVTGLRVLARQTIEASSILGIRPTPITLRRWWAANLPALRIILKDAAPIDVLPGRDDLELEAIAAMLRRMLSIPEIALSPDHP